VKLTSLGELALKGLLELAKAETAGAPGLTASEIARRCHASQKFLEIALLKLRAAGFVVSRRGAHGGYRLAHDPDRIFVGDISRLIDGPLAPAPCASVTRHYTCDWCEDEARCELKIVWTRVREAVATVMDSVSLADLIREAETLAAASDRYLI
jgi:Rrf2 family protein